MNVREGGWSVVELMASMTVLVLGLLSLAAGFHGAATLAESTRDTYLLNLAHRNMVGELQGSQFQNLAADYGPGSGKDSFWLDAMTSGRKTIGNVSYQAPPTNVHVPAGSLLLYDTETAPPSGWQGISGNLDLNCDGKSSGSPCTDYRILPVRISVTLPGRDGPRTLGADIILTKPKP